MTIDLARLEDLRRRVQRDPASIVFAQLAEELRRANLFEEAVATCRAGLALHPSYVSARVTLGRALFALDRLDEAEAELKSVLSRAPDTLSALKTLGEICRCRGRLEEALAHFEKGLSIARNDPDLQHVVEELTRKIGPRPAVHAPSPAPAAVRPPRVREQLTIKALEQWLDAINVARTDGRP